MKINSIHIENFKGIRELDLNLDARLNIFIGDNGSGKTALIEALVTAVGSLFIGIRDVSSKGIRQDEVHFSINQEFQFPVIIQANGQINGKQFSWSRERNTLVGSTTSKNAHEIKTYGKLLDQQVRKGEAVNLPLISYFSTSRLFLEAQTRTTKKQKKEPIHLVKELGSRFRGYRQSLDAKSNFKRFIQWFRQKEISQIQKRKDDLSLNLVKTTIINTLPGCNNIYYDFDPDTNRGLTLEFDDNRSLPFNYLSDGMRSFSAMIADITHRCILLNPHLGENAMKYTEGIVLIDELDLHLHPSWQKTVIKSLLETFPNLQFIVSTHSPFLIQEAEANQLILLKDCKVQSVSGADDLSLEDIAEYLQGVKMPQWSQKKNKLYDAATDYFKALEENKETTEDTFKLAELIKPFSQNPAFDALIEQERLKKKK